MFNRMLSAFGIGGPSVDTVLDSPHTVPGQVVTGQVRVQGGGSDAEIGQVVLSLVTGAGHELARLVVRQGVRVPSGQLVTIPFQLQVPWATPVTAVGGAHLPGVDVGVRTELVIAGAPDQGDLDPVLVSPLPSQDRVLDAFGQLGFTFDRADLEAGRVPGAPQDLGVHQRLAFFPPAQYTGGVSEVELTFVASSHELHVVLQADRRGGSGAFATSVGDTLGQLRVSHQEALVTDWGPAIHGWLAQVAQRGQGNPAFGGQTSSNPAVGQVTHNPAFGGQSGSNPAFGGQAAQNPAFGGGQVHHNPAFSQPGHAAQHGYGTRRGFGRDDHDRQGSSGMGSSGMGGSGMGGMLAAGAAGVAGGVLGGMALDGLADEFFGDDEG
ncbi:sporulation protein [Nocardia sp. NRRL S-836]|uniref:sporulation protein n=1 Tax=Nocardia sp. NRRL S-836 TaxID=1519492 RepID=UPI0006AE789A|nr:sporulation protein [Nocardia sp. NRRL S-836]KOV83297.1 hypothetical protein ADL03_21035 [Nocardia sp. NRRL S-836]